MSDQRPKCTVVTSHRLCNQQFENQKSNLLDQPRKAKALRFMTLNSHKDNLGLMSLLGLEICYLSAAVIEPLAFKSSPSPQQSIDTVPLTSEKPVYTSHLIKNKCWARSFCSPNAVLCCHLNPACRESELETSQSLSPWHWCRLPGIQISLPLY